jgi:hypothetical protein
LALHWSQHGPAYRLGAWSRDDTASTHRRGIDVAKDKDIADDGLRGRVFDLGALVDYQDGAVVSRTLIKRPTGTVTLFAFDAAQELSEHTSPYDGKR